MVFEAQKTTITDAPRKFGLYVEAVVKPLSQARTDTTINVALAPHSRPTDWQTPKQRAWWFAVGINLWKGRKPKQDWTIKAVVLPNGGAITASNDMRGSPFVFKPGLQQRMHRGVWMDTETYRRRELVPLRRDMRQGWRDVTGVRR
jgi:hypothetical protein